MHFSAGSPKPVQIYETTGPPQAGRRVKNKQKEMLMRTSIKALLASTSLVSTLAAASPALADETAPPSDFKITGSAAVVSQYRFRGISQSNNRPAVQGAITVAHSSGFCFDLGSSASVGNSTVNIGGTEIDVYGGYTHGLAAAA
jgi:uncharacterized protein (TIGR02001 family)